MNTQTPTQRLAALRAQRRHGSAEWYAEQAQLAKDFLATLPEGMVTVRALPPLLADMDIVE